MPDKKVEAQLKISGVRWGRSLSKFLPEDGTLPVKIKGTIGSLKPSLDLKIIERTPLKKKLFDRFLRP